MSEQPNDNPLNPKHGAVTVLADGSIIVSEHLTPERARELENALRNDTNIQWTVDSADWGKDDSKPPFSAYAEWDLSQLMVNGE